MSELRVMKARRALDPAELRDPLGDQPPPTPAPAASPQRARRVPSRAARSAATASAPSLEARREPTGPPRTATTVALAGQRSAAAVMFDPGVWTRLVGLVAELRDGGLRLSVNALLVLILSEALPADDVQALDLVGRHELALAEEHPLPRREEHTVRLPRDLLERYTSFGRSAAARGFSGGRSAVVNAVVAIAGPRTAAEAAGLQLRARRARSAAVIREQAAPGQ